MVKSEKKRNPVWLKLGDYRVVALKPDFDKYAAELERAIQKGIPAYPDLARADFYDVALDEGWAYIHVYRDGHTVYLVAHSLSRFNSFSTDRTLEAKDMLSMRAREAGCDTLGGIEMLLAQAVEQFKLWTGSEPDREVMRATALNALAD